MLLRGLGVSAVTEILVSGASVCLHEFTAFVDMLPQLACSMKHVTNEYANTASMYHITHKLCHSLLVRPYDAYNSILSAPLELNERVFCMKSPYC